MNSTYVVNQSISEILDVLGPTVEFLTSLEESGGEYCVMRGTLPPDVQVPLHSHPVDESFYVLSGTVQVLAQRGEGLHWVDAAQGDFVQVPANNKHAFRNRSGKPVVQLITTSPEIGRFFQEVGRPVAAGKPLPPPSPGELERFVRTAQRYGHWVGSPEENAMVGISLP